VSQTDLRAFMLVHGLLFRSLWTDGVKRHGATKEHHHKLLRHSSKRHIHRKRLNYVTYNGKMVLSLNFGGIKF